MSEQHNAAGQPSQANNSQRRNKLLMGLGGIVAAAAIGYFSWYQLVGSHYVSTDNAYTAAEIAQITPAVSGTIAEVLVSDTDKVHKGDLLVVIDPADANLALRQADAELDQTLRRVRGYYANDRALQAQVDARKAEKAAADAQLEAAKGDFERANIDLDRRKALVKSGSISGDELTRAQNAWSSARASLTAAQASAAQSQAILIAAQQQLDANSVLISGTEAESHPEVLAAQARRDRAQLDLSRTEIRAPVDGVVAKRSVQLGQRVQAGTPLLSVVPVNQMYVDANFKEGELQQVRAGQQVEITADLYGKTVTYQGVVEGFSGGTGSAFAAIPAQNATGNWIKVVQRLPVRIRLDQQQLEQYPLRVGLSMQVEIDTSSHDDSSAVTFAE
ncbi:HlyD family secretion protein [Oceanobacter mangrovi]|uniref:HlyD family secretion protein n=1 Tax=Oceanobacter mangrovi TaxID=2862510 RepID=UPI001C8E1D70|nr:HlyD family secretion protein [Oceanobacter mangrovi]